MGDAEMTAALPTDDDVRACRAVCLIGATVKDELFEDESPIGKTIRIRFHFDPVDRNYNTQPGWTTLADYEASKVALLSPPGCAARAVLRRDLARAWQQGPGT